MQKIIYSSKVRCLLSREQTDRLMVQSAVNNERDGITGILLASSTWFLQYLEGPVEPLVALMNRISRDPRHHDVTVLERDYISERLFSGWSMSILSVSEMELTLDPVRLIEHHPTRQSSSAPPQLQALSQNVIREMEHHSGQLDYSALISEIAQTYREGSSCLFS